MKKYVDEELLNILMTRLEEIENKMTSIENCYPIGSIYLSVNTTNPNSILGFGTWEQIKDKFLLASGSTYTSGKTGGEATHKLTVTEMPSHTHTPGIDPPGTDTYNQYAFTLNRHYSSTSTQRFTVDKGTGYVVMGANKSATDFGGNNDIEQALATASTGGSTAHNNMPPYLVVNIWKRVS